MQHYQQWQPLVSKGGLESSFYIPDVTSGPRFLGLFPIVIKKYVQELLYFLFKVNWEVLSLK